LYKYEYPRMAVTVDVVLIDKTVDPSQILLIQRGKEPFEGDWALPGGFVDMAEPIRDAAIRELIEETGAVVSNIQFLGYYDAIDRDPRGRTLSFAFLGITSKVNHIVAGADDASEARWFEIDNLPKLAFDHKHIVAAAIPNVPSPKSPPSRP